VDAKALFDAAPEADAKALFDSAPEAEAEPTDPVGEAVVAAGKGALKSLTLGHRTDAALASLLSPSDDPVSYSQARKEMLADDARASQAHPIASAVGGMAPSLLVPGAAFSTLPRALATGAAMGAVQGVTNEPSDAPEALLRQGGRGAVLGMALSTLGVGAPRVAGAVEEPIRNVARAQMGRVLSNGGTPLQVGRKELSKEALDAALKHGAEPLGTTRGTAERLANVREVKGAQKGAVVDYLSGHGIQAPERELVADAIQSEGMAAGQQSMNRQAAGVYKEGVEDMRRGTVYPDAVPGPDTRSLVDMEGRVRSAQGKAKSAYQNREPTEVGEAHEDVAAAIRKAQDEGIEAQLPGADAETQAIGAQFRPLKAELGPIIEASRAANQGAAKAGRSRAISLSDTVMAAGGHGWMGLLNHFARTRGASTVAWGSHQLADKVAWLATTDPARLGKYGVVLSNVLQSGGQDALAAHLFVIGQTDPKGSDELRKNAEAE
jgi:hypothetical protein